MRIRLLLPSIALIVVTTMIPAGLRHPSHRYIAYSINGPDFFNNILLYMPLGMALGGSSLLRVFLCGLSLSTLAETLQIGYVDRIPSLTDVLSNTLGAVAGYLAARAILRATGYDTRSLPVPRAAAAIAIVIAILGAIGLVYHTPVSDFSNWNAEARLEVGPWNGNVAQVQVYPFALSASQIHDLTCGGAEPPGGLLPNSSQRNLYDALAEHHQLTLLACIRAHDAEPVPIRRIITFGVSRSDRNFTLAQTDDALTFLLRTPASGPAGRGFAARSRPVLLANRNVFVAAAYDGRVSRLYVDGQMAGEADLGARRPHMPPRVLSWLPQPLPVREIELGGAEALLSGLLSAGVLGCFGVPRKQWLCAITGIAAGAVVGGIVWIAGVTAPHLGLRILVESMVAGLTIAASAEPAPRTD